MKTDKHNDERIVAGCIENDRYFQELLYRKYFQNMMRMCLRYANDKDTAVEIVNNGFLRVFKKIDKYSGTGSLEGWIRRLVFNALSDYFKSRSRSIQFLELPDYEIPGVEQSTDQLNFEDLMGLVDLLPDATRRVFYLYAIEGYSHVEIADLIGISEGTSKWHLASARTKLKQWILKRDNFKQHAG